MKKKRSVLFLSPSFMDIYKDVISCLESKEYEVSWISDNSVSKNPFLVFNAHVNDEVTYKEFFNKVEAFWKKKLSEAKFSGVYDYFFTIDGLMVCPYLFAVLKRRNPSMKSILYLFDRIDGVYQIDESFKNYNAIYSFDLADTAKYHLNFLPIYWTKSDGITALKYDVFGFASHSFMKSERTKLFRAMKLLAKNNGFCEFIKLYVDMGSNKVLFLLKNFIKMFVKRESYIPFTDFFNGLLTGNAQSPSEFRRIIRQSKVILDTQASYQDGLTARFMWALGEGKKIITTNNAIIRYPFYSEEQFYILNDNNLDGIIDFIHRPFYISEDYRKIVEQYRIDNWIDTMFMS